MQNSTESTLNTTPTLNAQTEKPLHYSYLKEFRVEPCPLFKQHQCHQHRPYTCFHWHFANQRRRRPVRRRDGTFNYSPDIYCTKYDENSGVCPDGDDCPFLHRVAGDVERKYHLRYYKTALCVHPTDSKGQCVKNGVHCAFAHCPEDLRQPIFDIREIQQNGDLNSELLDQKDRTSFVVEDPVWQDQDHVLANYKTEPCKKPPRLCRQGYACPFYHNSKDRRRPPGIYKYRSTPCPAAKNGDEWADPEACETGDNCQYCHTRTEQQFHPEIFKSTKCNDMLQHGYCPRGPFCAFAHTDVELNLERPVKKPSPSAVSASVPIVKNDATTDQALANLYNARNKVDIPEAPYPPSNGTVRSSSTEGAPGAGLQSSFSVGSAPSYSSVLKQRSHSMSQKTPNNTPATREFVGLPPDLQARSGSESAGYNYPKAPGFEREQHSPTRLWTPEHSGPERQAVSRLRTTSLTLPHGTMDLGCTIGESIKTPPTPPGSHGSHGYSSSFGVPGPWSILPPTNTADSFGLMDDLNLEDAQLTVISERDEDDKQNGRLFGTSAPMSIPRSDSGSLSQSIGGGNTGGLLSSSGGQGQFRMSGSFNQSMFPESGALLDASVLMTELNRAKEELASHRGKLTAWEDGLKQARHACEAWKKEAESHRRRNLQLEAEKTQALQDRDAALAQAQMVKAELARLRTANNSNGSLMGGPDILLNGPLDQAYARLRMEMEQIQQRVVGPICGRCGRHVNGTTGNGDCPVCSPTSKAANGTVTTGN